MMLVRRVARDTKCRIDRRSGLIVAIVRDQHRTEVLVDVYDQLIVWTQTE